MRILIALDKRLVGGSNFDEVKKIIKKAILDMETINKFHRNGRYPFYLDYSRFQKFMNSAIELVKKVLKQPEIGIQFVSRERIYFGPSIDIEIENFIEVNYYFHPTTIVLLLTNIWLSLKDYILERGDPKIETVKISCGSITNVYDLKKYRSLQNPD